MTIINDPIYGFIRIPSALHFAVIEHPFFSVYAGSSNWV